MDQRTFTDLEYSLRKRKTSREEFLDKMDSIIPWDDWINLIKEHYPSGKRGRPPKGIETMLRMYLLQIWFNLSDEATEDTIYDSFAMRKFMHINFVTTQVPDATTLLKFRHLLEKHSIGEKIFADIKQRLENSGLIMHGGSIVDASIISAPSSTKNASGKRDEEMHSTKKGNQWYFGMKIHIGVDAGAGYVHTLKGTSANVHDSVMASELIREDDEVVYADSGYLGVPEQEAVKADEHLSSIRYEIARRPSSIRAPKEYQGIDWDRQIEYRKSSIRSKVEHPFLTVKRIFGYSKTVYKGLAKNMNRLFMLFGSTNLLMVCQSRREDAFIQGRSALCIQN